MLRQPWIFGNFRPDFGIRMYMNLQLLVAATVLLCSAALAQTRKTDLPCDYSGPLLRDSTGAIVLKNSDEMKARATH